MAVAPAAERRGLVTVAFTAVLRRRRGGAVGFRKPDETLGTRSLAHLPARTSASFLAVFAGDPAADMLQKRGLLASGPG